MRGCYCVVLFVAANRGPTKLQHAFFQVLFNAMKPDTPLDLGLFVYIGVIPPLCEVIRQPKCMCCMPAYCMSGGHEPAKVCFLYL